MTPIPHPIPMTAASRALTLATIFFLSSLAGLAGFAEIIPNTSAEESGSWPPNHIVISEILVSASGADYNGTDWNEDGDIGSYSDQFIEIWNPTNQTFDVSDWWIDDIEDGGSAPCSVGWNTSLGPDERLVFFRSDTDIELDYWDGDTVNLKTPDGTLIDSISYMGSDSWWDNSYIRNASNNGALYKLSPPTPGWEEGAQKPVTKIDFGRCYTPRDQYHNGAYVLTGRVVTMNDINDVYNNGSILIRDGEIEAVWATGSPPLGVNLTDVPVHHTGGTIYPGLIDMHNHMHYNTAPLWEMESHLSDNQRSDFDGYNNRYEWKNHPDYSNEVTRVKTALHSGPYWNMETQAMKYVEMKEVVGGTTAAQGGPSTGDESFDSILLRNIEYWNWGKDEIHTKVTELESDYIGNHIKTGNASGELDAWFLHLAEGVDESSRAEFDILTQNDLLVGELIVIHGTGLGQPEFSAMGDVGASLVWSPLSNLLLYGDTTDVATAKAEGVNIAISPDWSPSGAKSPLHELKIADYWDEQMLGDVFSNYEMVEMVTSNSADAMKWDEHVGRINPGMAADLLVTTSFNEDPYRNLIDAVDPDVKLTIMGGLPLFGDTDLMTALNGDDWEEVTIPAPSWSSRDDWTKGIDVTFLGVSEGAQSWESIVDDLTMAMRFNRTEMWDYFGDSFDNYSDFSDMFISGSYGSLDAVPLDPIFTMGDDRYFRVISGSVSANNQLSCSNLETMWYNGQDRVELDWPAGTPFYYSPNGGVSGGSGLGDGEGSASWDCPFNTQLCENSVVVENCPTNVTDCGAEIVVYCNPNGDGSNDCVDYIAECYYSWAFAGNDILCNYVMQEIDDSKVICPFGDDTLCGQIEQNCPNVGTANMQTCAEPITDYCTNASADSGCLELTDICDAPTPSEYQKFCASFVQDDTTSGGDERLPLPCNPGSTVLPDDENCDQCVCQADHTWLCDDGGCDQTNGVEDADGKSSFSGTTIGLGLIITLVLVLLGVSQLANNDEENPWEKDAVILDDISDSADVSDVSDVSAFDSMAIDSEDSGSEDEEDTDAPDDEIDDNTPAVPALPPMGPPPSDD